MVSPILFGDSVIIQQQGLKSRIESGLEPHVSD